MEINSESWIINDLIISEEKINPKPQYQRTPVWNDTKKKLLIDSILRGYDLPKFYVRKTPRDAVFDYEVIDGQQRMRAIWDFFHNKYPLNNLAIHGVDLEGKYFKDLSKTFEDKFINFELTFALIEKATQEEIRSLFARLQMGVSLNPPELRHAIASNIGNNIQMIVENHKFFRKECKIKNTRYKHQDYLDHVVSLIYFDDKYDLKAPILKKLYEDYSAAKADKLSSKFFIINEILDWMYEINLYSKGIFRNKWSFVDIFYFLYECYNEIKSVNADEFAENLQLFENKRKKYNAEPEKLIEDKTSIIYDRDMYDYIVAFKVQGSLVNNLKIRRRIFNKTFNNKINITYQR